MTDFINIYELSIRLFLRPVLVDAREFTGIFQIDSDGSSESFWLLETPRTEIVSTSVNGP